MLASACRRPQAVTLPFLLPRRHYAEQKVARTPRSTPQQTTSKPSLASHAKDRSLPSTASSTTQKAAQASAPGISGDEKEFAKVRMEQQMRQMEESGDQLEMLRLSYAAGMEPWSAKVAVMDLQIPPKITGPSSLKANLSNNVQNVLSMYRLASDFAFPGIITKWRFSPQLFATKSTDEKAWVAPFRHDLLEMYKKINQAIATGDKKLLKQLTAYEYQGHAYNLLQRNQTHLSRLPPGFTYQWTLHKLISPVQILSIRAFPLYSAPEEPAYGTRNCVQAIVKFESLQSLVLWDAKGKVVHKDGTIVSKEDFKNGNWKPMMKRVLEYLLCENKMFYTDGWYVRDQVFEGVKPRFHSTSVS